MRSSSSPFFLVTQAQGDVAYPSPKQAARAAAALGAESGAFVGLRAHGDAVAAAVGADGRHRMEYVDGATGAHYEALYVPIDAVVDAFERFAAGDTTRNPALRWSRLETRPASAWLSGVQRLPEGFYDIAPRLRRGERALDLRNEIMAEAGLTKLAAAKRVEEVEKLLRAARAAVFGGLLSAAIAVFYGVADYGWITSTLFGLGAAGQFAFAWYIFRESRP